MILPNCGINPISGKTLEEEIEIARGIGGRLPYLSYLSLIRRGRKIRSRHLWSE